MLWKEGVQGDMYNLNTIIAQRVDTVVSVQGQGEDMAVQLNEEEQLLVITRLHQVPTHSAAHLILWKALHNVTVTDVRAVLPSLCKKSSNGGFIKDTVWGNSRSESYFCHVKTLVVLHAEVMPQCSGAAAIHATADEAGG